MAPQNLPIESGIKDPDTRHPYLSHIKNIYPFWCVTQKRAEGYTLYFTFKSPVFVTAFTTEGVPGSHFSDISLEYASDHPDITNHLALWDSYSENITSGDIKASPLKSIKYTPSFVDVPC